MVIIAKINRWDEFVLLDGTVHPTAEAAEAHLASKVPQLGEAIVADYRVFSLVERGVA